MRDRSSKNCNGEVFLGVYLVGRSVKDNGKVMVILYRGMKLASQGSYVLTVT